MRDYCIRHATIPRVRRKTSVNVVNGTWLSEVYSRRKCSTLSADLVLDYEGARRI